MVHGDDVGRNDLRCQADILGTNEEWFRPFCLRPQKRGCLLQGTGTRGEGDERVKARPRIPPEKDRRFRGPPPEQWKC